MAALHEWARRELGETDEEGLKEPIDNFDEIIEVASKAELTVQSNLDPWISVGKLLVEIRPDVSERIESWRNISERIDHSLETLIWYAVYKSPNKSKTISNIMEMNDAAAELQVIIQQQQAFVNEYTEMKEAEKRRIEEEKRSVVNDNKHFEIEIEEKQRKIDALELEIKYSTERKEELQTLLDISNQSLKETSRLYLDEEIKTMDLNKVIETQHIAALQLQEDNEKKTLELRQKEKAIEEMSDQLEIGIECERKLSHANTQLSKYREKLQDMADMKEQLADEQAIRASNVKKILSLEEQVSNIPILQKQVDEYKQKVANSELEFRKLNKELSRQGDAVAEAEELRKELKTQADEHRRLTENYEKELKSRSEEGSGSVSGVGVGGTELSPVLAEKIARLESENKSLKSLLSENDLDKVASLVNELDVEKRVSASYETQLDETAESLKESQVLVSQLEDKITNLKNELNLLNIAKTKVDSELFNEKETREKESIEFKEELATCQSDYEKKLSTNLLQTQSLLWLQKTFNQHHANNLCEKLSDMTSKHEDMTVAFEEKESELKDAKEDIDNLNNNLEDMKNKISDLKQECELKIADTERTMQEQISEMKASYEKQISESENAHSVEVSEMKMSYENQISESEKAHSVEITDLENKISTLESSHSVAFADLQTSFDKQISEIKNAHSAEMIQIQNSMNEKNEKSSKEFELKLNENKVIFETYQKNHSISNEQQNNELNGKIKECHLLKFQLKESEDAVDQAEVTIRKLKRENSMFSAELQEVMSRDNTGGVSKTMALDYDGLQKEFRELSEKYKATRDQLRGYQEASATTAPVFTNGGSLQASESTRVTRSSTQQNKQMGDWVSIYERRVEKAEEEKREMLMKCNIAVSDREQAKQEAIKLKLALEAEKEKSTGLELQKERALRSMAQMKSAKKLKSTQKGLFASPPAKGTTDKENMDVNIIDDLEKEAGCAQS